MPTRTSEQEELAGRRRVQPHLLERPRLLEARHAAVEDEVQDLAIAQLDTGFLELADEDGRVGVGAVGDEGLGAVQDEPVALASRRGAHAAEGVGARAGLGDRPGADLVEGEQVEGPALLLFGRSLREDGGAGEADAHAHRRHHARAVAAELDDRDQGRRGLIGAGRGIGRASALLLARCALLLRLDLLCESARAPSRPCRRRRTSCAGCRRAAGRRARAPGRGERLPARRIGAPCPGSSAVIRSTRTSKDSFITRLVLPEPESSRGHCPESAA